MRELSLHILDLLENSIRAQATRVAVTIEALPADDLLRIVIEDDGTGLKVSPQQALDPFYTTKRGKRTGLGLSLFKAAAEATGGKLTIGKSSLAATGVRVEVEMGLRHIDRSPLGDLAGTLGSMVCTNPQVDFSVRLRLGAQACELHVPDLLREKGRDPQDGLAAAQCVMERVNAELRSANVL
jgi:signal transduction histidine kinase